MLNLFKAADLDKDGRLNASEFAGMCKGLEDIVREKCGEACPLNET